MTAYLSPDRKTPNPDQPYDVWVEDSSGKRSLWKTEVMLSEVIARIQKMEMDYALLEQNLGDPSKLEALVKSMKPFVEGCEVTIKGLDGSVWMSTGCGIFHRVI